MTLLTAKEAAELLSRSEYTLESWRKANKGPPYYTVVGRSMYDRDELLGWLANNRVEPEGSNGDNTASSD